MCRHRKKPTGKSAKTAAPRDDNSKELFEIGEWARDDVTMDRVGKSILMYSFLKEGNGSRGERVDDKVSCVSSGNTIKLVLHDFMFEEKKAGGEGSRNVFPADIDVIPAFSVVEVAINPANSGGFEEGFGVNITRIRPCGFTLYSMATPLGLELLPKTYAASVADAQAVVEVSPGLRRVVETRSTSFYGSAAQGSYVVKYSEDIYRLVGPKENPSDPLSRHIDVMDGGVFAVDIAKEDLLRFTNAVEAEEADSLVYAQCILDIAASAGALSLYIVHNEYLLRKDPNRSPFRGVPVLDTVKLLACVTGDIKEGVKRFRFPFEVANMDEPFLGVETACVDNNSSGEEVPDLPCGDLVLASENARVRNAYPLTIGDSGEEDIMSFLFVPKGSSAGGTGAGGRGGLERTDYRLLKKQRVEKP